VVAPEQLGPDFIQDPESVYERLRAARPVAQVTMPGGGRVWLITRYDDVRAALADPRLGKDWRRGDPGWEPNLD
jgi:cytochrome P450